MSPIVITGPFFVDYPWLFFRRFLLLKFSAMARFMKLDSMLTGRPSKLGMLNFRSMRTGEPFDWSS